MIVVVEGPSAAGKSTWCRHHAAQWLPEPGRLPSDQIVRYQIDRWRQAVALDAEGQVVVLDGDPFKLYYRWAEWRTGAVTGAEWQATAQVTRRQIIAGDLGFADLVLYSDPGEQALRGRKEADLSRTRRNFERNTAMRPYFRQWYEAVGALDQRRVIWERPVAGLTDDLLAIGPRPSSADPQLFDALVNNLHA